jgi:hypothetical protein
MGLQAHEYVLAKNTALAVGLSAWDTTAGGPVKSSKELP